MTDKTIREGGAGSSGSRTVREGLGVGGTVRESGAGATLRESTGPAGQERSSGPAWLPGSLANRFEVVEELPTRGSEADLYVVSNADGQRFVAKVYRRGIQPKEEILGILKRADFAHVVQLEEFGEEDGRWWELIEYIEHSSLKALIDQEGPKLPDATARQVLQELNDALTHLHALPIEHRDLKPDNVLVRTREPLDLVLADFGIASVMDASVRFTDTARTIRYAPPEAVGTIVPEDEGNLRNMVAIARTRWDYWSLGMILVEMLTGEHSYSGISEAAIGHRLATQNVDDLVEGVGQEAWRKLCRGLLRRDPGKRWGSEQVSLWLENERDWRLTVEDEVAPSEQSVRGIDFDGRSFTTPESLGAALSEDWSKAESFWKRRLQDLQTWIIDTLGQQERGKALDAIDKDQRRKIDAQVFSFIYILAPSAPLRFKGVELSPANLELIAKRAAGGDRSARTTLLSIYENDILTLASALEQGKGLSTIARHWRDAVSDYRSKLQDVERNGARAPALDGDTMVKLLAAAVPVSTVVSELRTAAQRATTSDARECTWFRNLGDPDKASVGAIMIMPHVIQEAEAGARERKGRLKAEREERLRKLAKTIGAVTLISTAIVALLLFFQSSREISRQVSQAARSIDAIIPEGRPGGEFYVSYTDGSGDSYRIYQTSRQTIMSIPSNRKCVWNLTPDSLVDGGIRLTGKRNRNILDWFFEGIGLVATCTPKIEVDARIRGDSEIKFSIRRNQQEIGSGAFNSETYEFSENSRIRALSARVWATHGRFTGQWNEPQSAFVRTEPEISMNVSSSGDFQARDQWEFRITYPDGNWFTCSHSKCLLNKEDYGSYQVGTYTLEARTKHRILASSTFTVR